MAEFPVDRNDERLLERVAPTNWTQPRPLARYDLAVIGAGTAGLVAAAGAAGLGARVALVEGDRLGGDCLNTGCVPSKALLRSARAVHDVRSAAAFGVRLPGPPTVDFAAVMERMRRTRAEIALHDAAARFRDLGVDVFYGTARFTGRDRIAIVPRSVGEPSVNLRFRRAIVATGASPAVPPVPGLEQAGYLTTENLWDITELPPRLAVLGAGPIGCELAQAFARLGARVLLVERDTRILPHEDPDAAAVVADALRRDGIELLLEHDLERVEPLTAGAALQLAGGSGRATRVVDRILIVTGRVPRIEGLDAAAAGVAVDQKGIRVDEGLRTTNRRVYAAGDVCSTTRFTHVADHHARIAVRNALFPGYDRVDVHAVPWCIYTDPELAQIGHSPDSAARAGISVVTYAESFASVDRALLEGEDVGFARVHVRRGSDEIVGATIVASHAGEMISEIGVAIAAGLGLGRLAQVVHPYPTRAEALRRLGEAVQRARLTPPVKRLLERWFALGR